MKQGGGTRGACRQGGLQARLASEWHSTHPVAPNRCHPYPPRPCVQVLLPFRFDQAAIDAVTGTTAPQVLAAQAAQEAALAAQEAVQPAGK